MTPLLSGASLCFDRGDAFALGPVDLAVSEGGLSCIVGPNGAGKSTLLSLLAGVETPGSGVITLFGEALKAMDRKAIARKIGYLPQNVQSVYSYTAKQVVAMGRFALDGGSLTASSVQESVVAAMEKTGTTHLMDRGFSRLSGGERQRVLLASVLVRNPALLLLDEPTTGLDPHHAFRFFDLLTRETGKGTAALVVTHDLNLAAATADHLILMANGRILAEGRPETVLTEDRIARAYGIGVAVWPHPDGSGRPVVLPGNGEKGA